MVLWELRYEGGEFSLKDVGVLKETAQMYFLEGSDRNRVSKSLVDTPPVDDAYGRFFTSPALAISYWENHYGREITEANQILEALKRLKGIDHGKN